MNWLLILLGYRLRWRLVKGDSKIAITVSRTEKDFGERWVHELNAVGWRTVSGPLHTAESVAATLADGLDDGSITHGE